MYSKSIMKSILFAVFVTGPVIAILGIGAAISGEPQDLTATNEIILAQSGSPPKEPPKAKSTLLLEQTLEGLPGFKVQVVLIDGPPGWVGSRHYHPGYLFGYVLEGTYHLNYDDLGARTIREGEVFYETPNSIMRSRNGSNTERHRNIVFHILREDQPPAVSVD